MQIAKTYICYAIYLIYISLSDTTDTDTDTEKDTNTDTNTETDASQQKTGDSGG